MAFFSIENVLSHKIIKNIIDINYNIIMNGIIETERKREDIVPLSLIHPRDCQIKIPIKDRSSLIRPNLKTFDDILTFKVQ